MRNEHIYTLAYSYTQTDALKRTNTDRPQNLHYPSHKCLIVIAKAFHFIIATSKPGSPIKTPNSTVNHLFGHLGQQQCLPRAGPTVDHQGAHPTPFRRQQILLHQVQRLALIIVEGREVLTQGEVLEDRSRRRSFKRFLNC